MVHKDYAPNREYDGGRAVMQLGIGGVEVCRKRGLFVADQGA